MSRPFLLAGSGWNNALNPLDSDVVRITVPRMTARSVLISIMAAAVAVAGFAADAPPAGEKKLTPKEALKARMRAEGKKQPAPATTTGATTPDMAATPTPATPTKDGVDANKKKSTKTEPPAPPPTIMPQVDVRGSRITELDQQVAKQEREIAREKENTKPTEVDRALNDSKVAKFLSIFGGESAGHRAGVAQERVNLMEAEKDLLEAMKTARTKEEKAALQKQLDELKAYRRELEKSLR